MSTEDQNMTPTQHPRPSMDPHEDWLSHQHSHPSSIPDEDWLSHKQHIVNILAEETSELRTENGMLRENIKKAEEIAAADKEEKDALREEVKGLREKNGLLEKGLLGSREFMERSFGVIAAGAGVDISGVAMLSRSGITQSIDDAGVNAAEEAESEMMPEVQAEVPEPEEEVRDMSILVGLIVDQDGKMRDLADDVVGEVFEGEVDRICRMSLTCNRRGEFKVKKKTIGRAHLV